MCVCVCVRERERERGFRLIPCRRRLAGESEVSLVGLLWPSLMVTTTLLLMAR